MRLVLPGQPAPTQPIPFTVQHQNILAEVTARLSVVERRAEVAGRNVAMLQNLAVYLVAMLEATAEEERAELRRAAAEHAASLGEWVKARRDGGEPDEPIAFGYMKGFTREEKTGGAE